MVMVVQPVHAPTQVPMASTRKGLSMPGRLPSLSSILALPATPSTVPRVEKKSPKNAINTHTQKLDDAKLEKSKLKQIEPISEASGMAKMCSGSVVTPKGMPKIVMAAMPMSMAPFTL